MRINFLCRCIAILFVLSASSGCAFGHKYNYHEVMPNLKAEGSGQIGVATHDQRPYVVKGKTPTFVGLTRAGFGNPYGVATQSGKPLAEDMTTVICNALKERGFQCIPVFVDASYKPDQVRQKLKEAASERALLLTIYEWKSDTYLSTALLYNVTLIVLDQNGTSIAETRIEGKDILGSNVINPVGVAYKTVPQAFKKKLEELLNQPVVIDALQSINRS